MKIANKNKKAFKIGKEILIVEVIKPPVFYCQGEELTEYDTRNIQAEVAYGNITHEQANALNITDERGGVFVFRPDGTLMNAPHGYDIMRNVTLAILRQKKLDEIAEKNKPKI